MSEKTSLIKEEESRISFLDKEEGIPKQTWIYVGLCFVFVIMLIILGIIGIVVYILVPKIPSVSYIDTRKIGFSFNKLNTTVNSEVKF